MLLPPPPHPYPPPSFPLLNRDLGLTTRPLLRWIAALLYFYHVSLVEVGSYSYRALVRATHTYFCIIFVCVAYTYTQTHKYAQARARTTHMHVCLRVWHICVHARICCAYAAYMCIHVRAHTHTHDACEYVLSAFFLYSFLSFYSRPSILLFPYCYFKGQT
jgi:hypothetical protein